MIIAVSDIHIGRKYSNLRNFEKFLKYLIKEKEGDLEHFVICGDLFDFAVINNWSCFKKGEKVVELLNKLDCEIHFIYGNHDILFSDEDEMFTTPFNEYSERNPLVLENGGKKFMFKHGYSLDVYTSTGLSISLKNYENFWKMIQFNDTWLGITKNKIWLFYRKILEFLIDVDYKVKDLAESEAREYICDVPMDCYLIYGHTHIPYVGNYSANCGSWLQDSFLNKVFISEDPYIVIEDGEVELKSFLREGI